MRATRVHGLKILLLFAFSATALAVGERSVAEEERTPPPGIVIDKSPDFKRIHIGSPSMEILPDGTYVASHDWFGPAYGDKKKVTVVFQSKDKGATWRKISEFEGQKGSMMFAVGSTLWHIGWCTPGVKGKSGNCIAIRRSDDGGKTWSVPTDEKTGLLLSDKHYFVDPAPVLFYKGRIWKEVEIVGPKDKGPRNWATGFQPMVASAPQDADLLDRSNWTFSNSVPWTSRSGLGGWLEGNVLFTPEGKMIIQMRVDDIKNCGKAAQVQVSDDGKTASYDPASGFVAMPGGCKKFVIKFDPVSKKYWSLVDWVHPDDVNAPDKERVQHADVGFERRLEGLGDPHDRAPPHEHEDRLPVLRLAARWRRSGLRLPDGLGRGPELPRRQLPDVPPLERLPNTDPRERRCPVQVNVPAPANPRGA